MVWHENQKTSHPHDSITYTKMVSGLDKSRIIVDACDLFEKLKAKGWKPNSESSSIH